MSPKTYKVRKSEYHKITKKNVNAYKKIIRRLSVKKSRSNNKKIEELKNSLDLIKNTDWVKLVKSDKLLNIATICGSNSENIVIEPNNIYINTCLAFTGNEKDHISIHWGDLYNTTDYHEIERKIINNNGFFHVSIPDVNIVYVFIRDRRTHRFYVKSNNNNLKKNKDIHYDSIKKLVKLLNSRGFWPYRR